jgi:hypothetical protein
LELRTEGLAFSIVFTPQDDEGWMWCNATVDAPGFRGDLDFQMLRSDLELFRTQLSDSLAEANWPCEARLVSTDPGIELSFRVERTGQVAGTYQFGGLGTHHPVLSGSFGMDQTYLGPLLSQVERALADHT